MMCLPYLNYTAQPRSATKRTWITKSLGPRYPGFSLLELAIALVIMGVMAVGVLKGRALITTARLRSVAAQVRDYQTAVLSFREMYGAWPGDYDQATFAFNAAANGQGTGIVTQENAALFWDHLAKAGYITLPKKNGKHPRQSFPESPLGGYFTVQHNPSSNTSRKGQWLVLSGNRDGTAELLSPQTARALSHLMEDASPNSGDVQADSPPGGSKCLQANGEFSTLEEPACMMYFKLND